MPVEKHEVIEMLNKRDEQIRKQMDKQVYWMIALLMLMFVFTGTMILAAMK